MSIFDALGAVPSNFTVPLIVATVAGSMGVAGCAGRLPILPERCSIAPYSLLAARRQDQQRAQCQHADRNSCPTCFLIHDVALSLKL